MAAVLAGWCVAIAAVAACGTSYSGGDANAGAEGGQDGNAPDTNGGGSPDTGDDSTSDGGGETGGQPNLLVNGDFELGCAGWDKSFGFISDAPIAHSGSHSCKFCMDTNWEAFFQQANAATVGIGESYYGELWVRAANIPEDAGFVSDDLDILETAAGGTLTGPTAGPFPIGSGWVRVTTIWKTTAVGTEIGLRFRLQQSGNPASVGNVICVYVDDAVLRRMP
jgi:hypothetical protein